MSIRPLKWTVLAAVLILLVVASGFTDNLKYGIGRDWRVTPGQPAQMSSRVDYDPKLTDPFFRSQKRLKKPLPHLTYTANCYSTSFDEKHSVRFCKAELLGANMIDLFIGETNPEYGDNLTVQIRNGMFMCQYKALYKNTSKGLIWTTKRQKLALDNKTYRKGDLIKGRIDFECLEKQTDPMVVEKYGRRPRTITVDGVFKTIVD